MIRAEAGSPKLLQQVRRAIRVRHYSPRTLHRDLGPLGEIARAKQPARLPVVLAKDEVRAVLARLSDAPRVAALLMYGSGLRLLEALQLRVKDLDFTMREITIRRAKGGKGQVTVLPDLVAPVLRDMRRRSGAGSSSSRQAAAIAILRRTSWCAITCTNLWYSERSRPRFGRVD